MTHDIEDYSDIDPVTLNGWTLAQLAAYIESDFYIHASPESKDRVLAEYRKKKQEGR